MKLTFADFSGGLTDSTFTSAPNCAEVIDNFLIQKDKTIETVPGIEVYSSTAYRVPSNKRISKFAELSDGNYVAFSNQRAYYITSSAVTEITGPTGNKAFNNGDENSIVSTTSSLGHVHATTDSRPYQIKIYIDENGDPQLRTAGLPMVASNPTITPAAGTNNWIYAFVYKYTYNVGNITFIDRSAPRYVTASAGGLNVSITNIPVLSNGSDYNWDTSNIKVEIYRTQNNGQSFYYCSEVTNGTTNYTDTTTDANLLFNETLYTNGGIRPNDLPDPSKYLFEANDTQYALNILQDTEEKPFRFKQAITNDPDSVPDDFFTDLRGTIMGGGSIGRSPIIFTDKQTVRIDGLLDETGKGVIQREPLSNTVGAINHNGIVQMKTGLAFPGPDAFYKTNGVSEPVKLAREVSQNGVERSKIERFYRAFTDTDEQKARISGVYDPLKNRVYWVVQEDSADCDKIYVYDETYDAFTTISNNAGILPTALIMDGEDLIVGDANGYIFRMSTDFYTHPVVELGTNPSTWDETTIIYRWKSVQITGGDAAINKWFTKANIQGNPSTNVNMAILSYTNGEDTYKELYPVRVTPSLTWGDPDFVWGDDAFVWNRVSTLNQTRRFPKGRLRARQRQVEFTNAYYTILSSTSDPASRVTINGTSNIATLVTPSSYSFGSNNEGYDFTVDGKTYEVISGTADTLTLADPDGTLVNGTYDWELSGYGKGQRAHLLNFSVEFEPMSDAGTQWHGVST